MQSSPAKRSPGFNPPTFTFFVLKTVKSPKRMVQPSSTTSPTNINIAHNIRLIMMIFIAAPRFFKSELCPLEVLTDC